MHFKRPEYAALNIGVAKTIPLACSTAASASAIWGSWIFPRSNASAGRSLTERNLVSRFSACNRPNICRATSAVRDFDDGLPEIARTICRVMRCSLFARSHDRAWHHFEPYSIIFVILKLWKSFASAAERIQGGHGLYCWETMVPSSGGNGGHHINLVATDCHVIDEHVAITRPLFRALADRARPRWRDWCCCCR